MSHQALLHKYAAVVVLALLLLFKRAQYKCIPLHFEVGVSVSAGVCVCVRFCECLSSLIVLENHSRQTLRHSMEQKMLLTPTEWKP